MSHFSLVMRYPVGPLAVFLLLAALQVGCDSAPKLPTLAPVKGQATLDGTALTAGNVSLHPETIDTSTKTPPSSGQINSSGAYEIFTGGKPGAPLGKYKVVVTPAMVPGQPPAAYDKKFMDEKATPLRLDVTANAAAGSYDLKLTK